MSTSKIRICIDLDGVICPIKNGDISYADLLPLPGAVEKIKCLKDAGHYIIINTARHMKTCGSNVGLVNAKIAEITLEWLKKYDIMYDEIYFGKPWCDVYIDDNAYVFKGWEKIDHDGANLLRKS